MVGFRAIAIALLATLLAWPASGSLIESQTAGAVAYQFDGDTHHDAPDACDGARPGWSLPFGGRTDGMLLPPDDLSDVFLFEVPVDAVGDRLTLRLTEAPAAGNLDLFAYLPGCVDDVLAPASQPVPPPAPPAPSNGETQVGANTDGQGPCGDDWFFHVRGLEAAAPASLHAAWTDGSEGSVPLVHETRGVAMYRTDQATAFTLTGAWANVPAGFAGSFDVVHSPCGASDGGAVYGLSAQQGDDRIAFTPVRAGAYTIVVRPAPPAPAAVPTAVPLSCHVCIDGVDDAAGKSGYTVSSESQKGT